MKLVDILARDLDVWPEASIAAMQDADGEINHQQIAGTPLFSSKIGQWMRSPGRLFIFPNSRLTISEDFRSAIVTRAEWQAAVDALNAGKVVEWPEGATHKYSEPTTSPWRDLSGPTWKWFDEGKWKDSERPSDELLKDKSDRLTKLPCSPTYIPAEWDSLGFPSIKVVCEFTTNGGNNWKTCKILYADELSILTGEVEGKAYRRLLRKCDADVKFRQIRTPEQIKKEERSKACDAIYGVLTGNTVERKGNKSDMAEALYDAGYRRVEQ